MTRRKLLGGIAAATGTDGALQVRYSSGLDLLRQTPQFVRETRINRLEGEFEHAYRYLEPLFDGKNPYIEAIDRNLGFLDSVLRSERWRLLRRWDFCRFITGSMTRGYCCSCFRRWRCWPRANDGWGWPPWF